MVKIWKEWEGEELEREGKTTYKKNREWKKSPRTGSQRLPYWEQSIPQFWDGI